MAKRLGLCNWCDTLIERARVCVPRCCRISYYSSHHDFIGPRRNERTYQYRASRLVCNSDSKNYCMLLHACCFVKWDQEWIENYEVCGASSICFQKIWSRLWWITKRGGRRWRIRWRKKKRWIIHSSHLCLFPWLFPNNDWTCSWSYVHLLPFL